MNNIMSAADSLFFGLRWTSGAVVAFLTHKKPIRR